MSRERMSQEAIAAAMVGVPGWSLVEGRLELKEAFSDFAEAFGFLSRVALLAERADHHPEIWNVWNRVRLTLWTHDAGGLTTQDFALAAKINAALGR